MGDGKDRQTRHQGKRQLTSTRLGVSLTQIIFQLLKSVHGGYLQSDKYGVVTAGICECQ